MINEKQQYIYLLKLIPKLQDETNWTKEEEKIVERHYKSLQELKKDGRLILAGRTLSMNEDSFGVVILQVNSEKEARILMENDPAVKEGIMTASLYPYSVALISEKNVKQ